MKAPHFWSSDLDPRSREAAPLTRALLTPLSSLYSWGIGRKLRTAKPQSVNAKVICIGNITVGGVGKTPIVEAVRSWWTGRGFRAASLSRGYGGDISGPLKVDSLAHTAANVGDEPLMLSMTGESWIGKDRFEAAKAMVQNGVEVIVMDDGHQNPSLRKNLSLVAIDAGAPFGNGFVLPKGPLREPVVDSLSRADGVILMGDGPEPGQLSSWNKPILRAQLAPDGAIPAGPLVAFAGIGRPRKFFDGLKAAGGQVCEAVGYGDHYVYSPSDLRFLRALSKTHDARLITTTKDHVRLPETERHDILSFPVSAKFDDPAALDSLLSHLLNAPTDD